MISRFVQVQSQDKDLNQVQQNISKSMNPLFSNPIVGGNLITDVTLVSGDNLVSHGLGRRLIGWIIVRRTTGAVIYDKQSSLSDVLQTTQLKLNAGADCVVSLYVF